MTLDTPTLISTAVGALIGSALTLIAAVLTHQLDLRKAIVTTYSKGRAILDSYRMNNEILQKYEHWSWMHHETQSLVRKAKAEAEHTSLVCYAQTLKNYHQNLKERIQTLLRMLRKEGVLLSEKKE